MIPERYAEFTAFIQNREDVRLARSAGLPKPWSADPILQQYRFCNVNREHDTTTIWIRENIREAHSDSPILWFNLVLARFLNLPATLGDMGYVYYWTPKKFIKFMDDRQASGDKLFGNAYMIRAGTGEDAGMPKHHYLERRVFTPLWEARDDAPVGKNCEAWSVWFRQFFGFGDFMRNQIITDLKYTPQLDAMDTDDWDTFVLAGPGTTRGLNRLFGRALTAQLSAEILNGELQDVRAELELDAPGLTKHFVDLNNLSNCFCEFDKWSRANNGEGRPKQNYPGRK